MSKNDFQERLRRLEAKNPQSSKPTSTPQNSWEEDTGPIRTTRRKPVRPMTIVKAVMIMGAIGYAAYTGGGGLTGDFSVASLQTSLKDELKGFLRVESRSGKKDGPVKRYSDAKTPRYLTYQGWAFQSPGVASFGLPELVLADVSTGHENGLGPLVPARVKPFKPNPNCTLRRPGADEVVHNVRLENGTLLSEVHNFSDEEMGDALMGHIEALYSGSKRHYKYGKMAPGQMASVDVFVTDTSAPVYLVLQGFRANTIWNLHLADGVRLSHVAMIGEHSGMSAPPKGTSFEAIRISDFITDFEFGSNDEFVPCMVAPWLSPQGYWQSTIDAQNNNDLQANYTYSLTKGSEAYARWYQDVMGIAPSTNLVMAKHAEHVLVGPVPAQPVTFRPLSLREVVVTENEQIVLGNEAKRQLHDKVLLDATGGRLAALNPTPITEAVQ